MSESHDLWEAARGSQRDEVASIWEGRGAPPPRPPRRRDWRRIARIVVPLVAVVAVVALVIIPALRSEGDSDRRAAEAAQARLVAQERARLEREGRPFRAQGPTRGSGEYPTAYRQRLVVAGEAAITENAQRRIAAGELDGEVNGTVCRPFPYTSTREDQEADPAVPRNRYQCTAYSRRFALPELAGEERTGVIGNPYWLIADYGTGRLTFCKINPKVGEGGKVLVEVPPDPACLDPLA